MEKQVYIYKSNCVFDGCTKQVWVKLDNNTAQRWSCNSDHGHTPEEQEILDHLVNWMIRYIVCKWKGKESTGTGKDKLLETELVEGFRFLSTLKETEPWVVD